MPFWICPKSKGSSCRRPGTTRPNWQDALIPTLASSWTFPPAISTGTVVQPVLRRQGAPFRRQFSSEGAIGIDDPEGRLLAHRLRGRLGPNGVSTVSVSDPRTPADSGIVCRDQRLSEFRCGRETYSADLSGFTKLQGVHNRQIACAANSACRFLGLNGDEIASGMESFPGLAHPMQILGTFRCIQCVNDSKATKTKWSEMELTSSRRNRWIAGGQGKEGGLSRTSAGLENVQQVHLIGSTAHGFAERFGALEHEICGEMAQAVNDAFRDAAEGDTILLSPAAASFDQCIDFEARGDDFAREVRHRAASG